MSRGSVQLARGLFLLTSYPISIGNTTRRPKLGQALPYRESTHTQAWNTHDLIRQGMTKPRDIQVRKYEVMSFTTNVCLNYAVMLTWPNNVFLVCGALEGWAVERPWFYVGSATWMRPRGLITIRHWSLPYGNCSWIVDGFNIFNGRTSMHGLHEHSRAPNSEGQLRDMYW